jgi:hypothetical protein
MSDKLENLHQMFTSKQAPALLGQPIAGSMVKHVMSATGCRNYGQLFGLKISDNDSKTISLPVNFGSKSSVGMLPEEVRFAMIDLKKSIDNALIQAQYKYRSQNVSPDMVKSTWLYKEVLDPKLKAFDITDFSEWIPTIHTRFYFEEYEIPLLLADNFDQMPMDSSLVKVPGVLGNLFGQLETDDAVFTAQSNTQSQYTVESKNNVVHTVITQDLMDDSAPAIIDKLRKEVLMGIARSYERAIIDGDTQVTHQDSDVTAATDFRKAFDGLRRKAFVNDAALGAGTIVYDHLNDTPSKDLFAKVLKLMGKFGSSKADLKWIMPISVSHDLVTGAIPELFTAFAFGGLASNVTGQVPPVYGIQGVNSEYVREDLNASGVYDGITTDRTALILVKTSRFMQFIRQAPRVWAAPSLPSSDTMLMSAKARHSWNGNPQSAEEKSVVMAINIAQA